MAYNGYFNNQNNGYYGNNYMNPQPVQNLQMQNSGFVSVPSEEVARNYPVAIGNSVTFKNENAPYIYTKTMGFSQLDRPIFEKYKLIREEDTPNEQISAQIGEKINEMENKPIEEIKSEIGAIKEELETLKKKVEDFGA